LRLLGAALAAFADQDHGVLGQIERRLESARTLEQRTIHDRAAEWDAAVAAIADPDGPYRGLVIRPQLGLVPLGPDPESGLWEFGHCGASGEIPGRDGRGALPLDDGSALVLVFLPGGTYRQGDAGVALPDYEGPSRTVTLAPFFLSKYEMTQAQWLRVAATNPSQHEVGTTFSGIRTTGRHPVEFVTWLECAEVMRRLDLCLPTEAQWEFALRGGTSTRYWTGEQPESLAGTGNMTPRPGDSTDPLDQLLQDAWDVHAPVGSFRPNPYGLHDMIGNVKEWCRDPWFGDYHELPLQPGDGLVLGDGDGHFAIRGSCYGEFWVECRSTWRSDGRDAWRQPWLGVRPARNLTR
jgi:formylglycine-generating enzyme required for sulfatase activity